MCSQPRHLHSLSASASASSSSPPPPPWPHVVALRRPALSSAVSEPLASPRPAADPTPRYLASCRPAHLPRLLHRQHAPSTTVPRRAGQPGRRGASRLRRSRPATQIRRRSRPRGCPALADVAGRAIPPRRHHQPDRRQLHLLPRSPRRLRSRTRARRPERPAVGRPWLRRCGSRLGR